MFLSPDPIKSDISVVIDYTGFRLLELFNILFIYYLFSALRKTIFGFAFPVESEGYSANIGCADRGIHLMMLSTHKADA